MSSLTVPGSAAPVEPQEWADRYAWPTAPTLRANMVTSLDGRSTLETTSGGLSSPADQLLLTVLRATADVVVVGAGTVRAEGYDGIGTDSDLRRLLRPDRPDPVRLVVVTGNGLSQGLSALRSAAIRPLILTTADGAARTPADTPADIVVVGDDSVDPHRLVDALTGLGARRLLCEGGPTLLGSLLDAGVVDELCLTHAPLVTGRSGRELIGAANPRAWRLHHAFAVQDHLFTLHRGVR